MFLQPRPYSDPDIAARKIVDTANDLEPSMAVYGSNVSTGRSWSAARNAGRILDRPRSRNRKGLAGSTR